MRALAPAAEVVIVVDVLSFSTAVDIALARGASVLPYRWKNSSAAVFAESKGALLAGSRAASGYSLSPASLESIPSGSALVLPSPDGSTLSPESAPVARTYCACIRNATAVASHIGARVRGILLRPCAEDLIGAGAAIAGLTGSLSPEAEIALAALEKFRDRLCAAIRDSGSGRELAERGFHRDIELAAEYGVSACVPLFSEDRFLNAIA